MKAAGKVEGNLDVAESGYAKGIKSDAVLGVIPQLTYNQNLKVEKVKLSFNINGEYISNESSEYSEVAPELEGIKKYNIFKYFEEDNILLPIETKFDVENNTLYTEVDTLGTYCVIDMEKWLSGLDIAPESNVVETQNVRALSVSPNAYSSNSVSQTIWNEYIAFNIDVWGRYTMGTVEGDPLLSTDNNKRLLFGYPEGSTSATTIRIDNANYIFESQETIYDQSHRKATSVINLNGVKVEQELKIIENMATGRHDVVQIKYRVKNTSTDSKHIGVRIMMDTMLGDNDRAPFRVMGKAVTTETEYSGNNIPQMWQAFDSLTNPGVVAQGTFFKSDSSKPDKVQFTNWSRVLSTPWDYKVSTGVSNGDSAVSAIWNQKTFDPGVEYEYTTYYGLSEFTSDLRPPLALSVYANNKIERINNKYTPLNVSSFVENIGNGNANNVKFSIDVRPELKLITSNSNYVTSPFNLGDIKPKEQKNIAWLLEVNDNYSCSKDKAVDIKINLEYTDSSDGTIKVKHITKTVLIQQNVFNAIISTGLKKIALGGPLSEYSQTDSDKDGLSDWNEVDTKSSLIKWDSNGAIILPSLQKCIDYKSHLTYVAGGLVRFYGDNYSTIGSAMWAKLQSIEVLPILSDPTDEDSDGDGLFDGSPRFVKGGTKKVAPKDREPLMTNGPVGVWEKHYWEEYRGGIPTKLDGLYKTDTDWSLGGIHSPAAIKVGEIFCNMRVDDRQIAVHAKVETWQETWGYNDIIDILFKTATNNNMRKEKFRFKIDNKEYIVWTWKGNYLNLGSGAEIGIYQNPHYIKNTGVVQWDSVSFRLPMTLNLYNYNSVSDIENVFTWAPVEKQWWITGFNPKAIYPNAGKMVSLGTMEP